MTFLEWWVEYRGFDDQYGKDGSRDCWNAAIGAALEIARRHETMEPEVDDIIKRLVALKEKSMNIKKKPHRYEL